MLARRFTAPLLVCLAVVALIATAALAQDGESKSRFERMLEGMLSSADRQVSVSGLSGALSSNPTVQKITVADRDGVWLEIDNVAMVWSRTALLRGRLSIDTFTAGRVAILRKPAAARGEGGPVSLPVDVDLRAFDLPDIELASAVVESGGRLAAKGSAQASNDAMALRLAAERRDRPGTLALDLRFEPAANVLTADVKLSEPQGGLLAELLRLRGEPALAIDVTGKGPLANWQATLAMRANDAPVLSGTVAVTRPAQAYRVVADLRGALAALAPPDYAALLAGESRLAFDASRAGDGSITLTSASLTSQGVDLSARGTLASDLVPSSADVTLKLGQGGRTALPFAPGGASVAGLEASFSLAPGAAAAWRANIAAMGLQGSFGSIASLNVAGSGEASNLTDPASRAASFKLDGSAGGLLATDAALGDALGRSVKLSGFGSWSAGRPVTFETLELALGDAVANFAGRADAHGMEGRFAVNARDLARLSALAGRPLGGALQTQATGSVVFAGLGFDLALAGEAADLRLGVASLDPLLSSKTTISGGLARRDGALVFDKLALANPKARLDISGTLGAPALDLTLAASIPDVAAVTPRATGSLNASARVSGTTDAPHVEGQASGNKLVLMGRALTEATASFSGTIAGPQTQGSAELAGVFAGAPVKGSARLVAGVDGAHLLDDLLLSVGENRASGSLAVGRDGLVSGRLSVAAPDLAKVAPLFLVDARGKLNADIGLAGQAGGQSATVSGAVSGLAYEGVTLASGTINGAGTNLTSSPQIDGTFDLRGLRTRGLAIVSAKGSANRQGNATDFAAQAVLADGKANAAGNISPSGGGGSAIALKSLSFARRGIALSLAAPTRLVVERGAVRFDPTTLKAGTGTITLAGSAGPTLDLAVTLKAVPAALANNVAPSLGAAGAISGTLALSGQASAPSGRFKAAWQGASVAAARDAGLGPLSISAEGSLAGGKVQLAAKANGAGGLTLQANGAVGLASGNPLDLRVTGKAPLALANRTLAPRGAVVKGALDINVAIGGTAAAPQISGRIGTQGGSFVDPETGLVLTNLNLAAGIADNRLSIERLTANSGKGTVAASGSIALAPGSGFPADIKVQVRKARYVRGALLAATLDSDLTLTGNLAAGPRLGGTVSIDGAEVTVPERLPRGSLAVQVKHLDASAAVKKTVALAQETGKPKRQGDPSAPAAGGLALDVTIKAPQRIFVRGRGLDAELGGTLTLTGSAGKMGAAGAFELRRGRLDILTQRISLDRGTVTFAGDLDPILDFSGTTTSKDITVTVAVTGRASDPEVTFSSVPQLPQDEVLAHLIFNRGVGDLSPLQIARLASAAAQLSGASSGTGILNQLRQSTGLDDLDVVSDAQGAPALAAGRYVSENVYVGVQQGATTESSKLSIDLDVTKDVKARAAVSPQGDSSLGLFFEHEY